MLINELFNLKEAEEARKFELSDMLEAFPEKAEFEKHTRKLWGTDKLTFGGKPFFDDIYNAIDKIQQDLLKDKLDAHVETYFGDYDVGIDDMQEVYVGYNPKKDTITVGFDAWMNPDDLSNKLEDDGLDQEEIRDAMKAANDVSCYVLVELNKDLKMVDHEVVTNQGTFYPKGHKKIEAAGLYDLRLD